MKNARMMAFRATVKASYGTLLGGVKVHQSSWFEAKQDAQDWAHVIVKNNKESGRDVGDWYISQGLVPVKQVITSMKKNPRQKRTRRNPAALAVLKAAEAAHYMRKNPKPRRVYISGKKVKFSPAGSLTGGHRSRMSKGQDSRNIKRALRKAGFRVNPKPRISFRPAKNHIRLQAKRGGSWITLAFFPLTQKAFAVKIAKQHHRRHPGATLRLVS